MHRKQVDPYEGSLDKAPNGTKQNTNADELPERFVSVRLPFFLPDMLEQMPIIGHEIAHAVLSDLYGQLGGGSWLQFSESTVAKYMNALVLTYKGWIGDESVRSALPNVVEVVADAFAMVRFRGAFLYSAFMTAFESSTLSGMATDEFGKSMISTWIESVRQSKAENRNRKWGSHDARSFFRHHAKGDQIEITNVLLRLLVLSLTTANVNSNDADTATVQLSEGVTSICKDVLQILHEDEFAIAGVLDDDSPTIKSIGRLAEALARINFENLGPAIERFWKPVTNGNSGNGQVYEDYFLDLQRLSSKQSAAWTKYCESQGYESRTSDFATDFFWKRKWARATNSVTTSRALGAPNSDVLLPLAVMEDYLNRTMSSKQLFNQLMLRNSANKTSCPTFFAVFGGNSVIGNVTSGSDHRQFVVQPSKEILQYLKTGNWTSGWFSSIHWDRESIVGTSAMINGSWPSIGPHDLAYRLTLISSSALNPKSSYPDQSMVVLLGRYDVATLTPLEDESCKSSGDDPTYSRRVVWLAPVDANVGKAAPPTMANVLGLMFIALASPMSWRILVTWLDLKIRKDLAQSKIIVHCMVSDGWEHVVILFEHLDIKKADMTPIQSVLDAVTTIRNHPCVVRTETIFCKSVLGLSSLRDNGLHVSVRFRCRAKSSNSVSSVDLLRHIKNPREVKEVIAGKEVIKEVNDFDKKFKGIEIVVRLLTGLTDFEVRLTVPHSREKKRFEAIRFVHDRLNAPESPISRLQSQIAF